MSAVGAKRKVDAAAESKTQDCKKKVKEEDNKENVLALLQKDDAMALGRLSSNDFHDELVKHLMQHRALKSLTELVRQFKEDSRFAAHAFLHEDCNLQWAQWILSEIYHIPDSGLFRKSLKEMTLNQPVPTDPKAKQQWMCAMAWMVCLPLLKDQNLHSTSSIRSVFTTVISCLEAREILLSKQRVRTTSSAAAASVSVEAYWLNNLQVVKLIAMDDDLFQLLLHPKGHFAMVPNKDVLVQLNLENCQNIDTFLPTIQHLGWKLEAGNLDSLFPQGQRVEFYQRAIKIATLFESKSLAWGSSVDFFRFVANSPHLIRQMIDKGYTIRLVHDRNFKTTETETEDKFACERECHDYDRAFLLAAHQFAKLQRIVVESMLPEHKCLVDNFQDHHLRSAVFLTNDASHSRHYQVEYRRLWTREMCEQKKYTPNLGCFCLVCNNKEGDVCDHYALVQNATSEDFEKDMVSEGIMETDDESDDENDNAIPKQQKQQEKEAQAEAVDSDEEENKKPLSDGEDTEGDETDSDEDDS